MKTNILVHSTMHQFPVVMACSHICVHHFESEKYQSLKKEMEIHFWRIEKKSGNHSPRWATHTKKNERYVWWETGRKWCHQNTSKSVRSQKTLALKQDKWRLLIGPTSQRRYRCGNHNQWPDELGVVGGFALQRSPLGTASWKDEDVGLGRESNSSVKICARFSPRIRHLITRDLGTHKNQSSPFPGLHTK